MAVACVATLASGALAQDRERRSEATWKERQTDRKLVKVGGREGERRAGFGRS